MLSMTPPMGWNSWNTFGNRINEQLIMETADAMVSTGLHAAGYEYVVIDDCWSKMRRENGKIVADPEKFPHGMKYVADYIHSKGLKFGMYSCAGVQTCYGAPGSFDHEFEDAQMFADFGVDFLKYDFCNKPATAHGPTLYNRMAMALRATGRDILFSACNWGSDNVGEWIRSTGAHMYRSTGDIKDNFVSCTDILLSQIKNFCYSAPGCWNDMDMLTVGMYGAGNVAFGGCTDEEYRTQFALWCLFQSPLMIGCDVRNMSPETLAILTDPELLRLPRDPEARPPFVVTDRNFWDNSPNPESTGRITFCKVLADNEYAIACVNFTDQDAVITPHFFDMGLTSHSGYALEMTDIRSGEVLPLCDDFVQIPVPTHAIRIFRSKLVRV